MSLEFSALDDTAKMPNIRKEIRMNLELFIYLSKYGQNVRIHIVSMLVTHMIDVERINSGRRRWIVQKFEFIGRYLNR